MGVLDIRWRRETTGVMPASRISVSGGVTGNGVAEGIARLASSAGRALEATGAAADAFRKSARERSQRRLEEAVADYQSEMTPFDRERMSGTIDEPEDWEAGNASAMKEAKDRIRKTYNMSDEQFAAFNRRTMGYDQTMAAGWGRRARTVRQDKDVGTTGVNLATATGTVSRADATPTAWADWAEAMDAHIAALERKQGRSFSPEERAAKKRTCGERVFEALTADRIAAVTGEALKRGADGGTAFDEQIKIMEDEKADWMPESSKFTDPKSGREINLLRDALGGADKERLKAAAVKDAKAAKAKWKTAYDAAVAKRRQEAAEKAAASVAAIYTSKDKPVLNANDPKSVLTYNEWFAERYKPIGKTADLDPDKAVGYLKAAEAFRNKANSADGVRDADFDSIFTPMSVSGASTEKQIDMLNKAVASKDPAKRISRECFGRCMKVVLDERGRQDAPFVKECCDAIGYAFPRVFERDGNGFFKVVESKLPSLKRADGRYATTGISRVVERKSGWRFDEKEDVLVGQVADALTYIRKQKDEDEKSGKASVKSNKEYVERFKELIRPSVEAYRKMHLQDALDEIDRHMGGGGDAKDYFRLPR